MVLKLVAPTSCHIYPSPSDLLSNSFTKTSQYGGKPAPTPPHPKGTAVIKRL